MRFIKYSLLMLTVCIVFVGLIFVLFRKGYKNYYSFEQNKLEHIIEGHEYYDALFIGSSRTLYQVNPRIIDSVLNLSSFNAGIGGANLLEMNMILKCYLACHPAPKYIIADVSLGAFDVNERPFFNPNIYFPFLHNKIVFNTLKHHKRAYLLKYLPFLQITECDDDIKQGAIAGLIGKEDPLEPTYKGYIESGTDTIPLPFKIFFLNLEEFAVSKKGTSLLEEVIETCKNNHIRLFITYSPIYTHDEEINPDFFPTLKKICDTTDTPFLNYRFLSMNKNNRLFREEHHLNKYGANIFTRILARDLRKLKVESKSPVRMTKNSHNAGPETHVKQLQ